MNEDDFAELRPWHDGVLTSVGYKPTRLVRAGYLRHAFDDFYELTAKGKRGIEKLRGVPVETEAAS